MRVSFCFYTALLVIRPSWYSPPLSFSPLFSRPYDDLQLSARSELSFSVSYIETSQLRRHAAPSPTVLHRRHRPRQRQQHRNQRLGLGPRPPRRLRESPRRLALHPPRHAAHERRARARPRRRCRRRPDLLPHRQQRDPRLLRLARRAHGAVQEGAAGAAGPLDARRPGRLRLQRRQGRGRRRQAGPGRAQQGLHGHQRGCAEESGVVVVRPAGERVRGEAERIALGFTLPCDLHGIFLGL